MYFSTCFNEPANYVIIWVTIRLQVYIPNRFSLVQLYSVSDVWVPENSRVYEAVFANVCTCRPD